MISIIVAMGKQREIGADNTLMWRLSNDLKLFKNLTMGHTIVMGRKTFESIGKALPGRVNMVVSSTMSAAEDILSAINLNDAIEMARNSGETEVFIIGGGQIYSYALELADKLYISFVDGSFEHADTFFPDFDLNEWRETESKKYPKDEKNEYDFVFKVFERKGLLG
ncbi:MAG: dihydrofolate reductase [Flavobacteriales bacterium]|nr:dihydrofolate reductase [Flavobacteriales bacterium]